jgi:uncharacterized protein
MAKKVIKILSIDGGGIRGVIPGLVMTEIEKRTGKPICKLFDLIAGTSTGGVLALGLTRPDDKDPKKPKYKAEDGVRMYEEEGRRIFSRSPWKAVRSFNGITDEKYPSEPVEAVLKEYFGDIQLKQALTDVLITSYEIERRFPWFFRSSRARKDPEYDFPMWKVARATSAAPTYFEPCKIETANAAEYYALVDGGVFANNPTTCAFVDAKIGQAEDTEYLVVSLGTGVMTRPIRYDEACKWGAAEWVLPVISLLMNGVSETVDYQMQTLLPNNEDGARRYYRFQARLTEGKDDMDDASKTNIRALKLVAEDLIHQNNDVLDALCKDLKKL